MKPKIDHIVIGARNLEQGVAYVKDILGVTMPFGGVHTQMGTHNHLMRLGEDVFLEILAVNPDAAPLKAPRWYGLDDPFVRRRLKKQPVLLTWVVNTRDIGRLIRKAAGIALGSPALMRRGRLRWHFAVPDDGRLLAGGMLPYLIEWHTDAHPATGMPDTGCRLQRLDIHHPFPDWLGAVLASINAADLVGIHALPKDAAPYLSVYITTPSGETVLRSC